MVTCRREPGAGNRAALLVADEYGGGRAQSSSVSPRGYVSSATSTPQSTGGGSGGGTGGGSFPAGSAAPTVSTPQLTNLSAAGGLFTSPSSEIMSSE